MALATQLWDFAVEMEEEIATAAAAAVGQVQVTCYTLDSVSTSDVAKQYHPCYLVRPANSCDTEQFAMYATCPALQTAVTESSCVIKYPHTTMICCEHT